MGDRLFQTNTNYHNKNSNGHESERNEFKFNRRHLSSAKNNSVVKPDILISCVNVFTFKFGLVLN